MKRRRKTTRGRQPRGSGRLLGKGTAEPSPEGVTGRAPWTGLHFYSRRRLLFEINIEGGHPTHSRTPWFSTATSERAELGAHGE